jgi:hypothetical protein
VSTGDFGGQYIGWEGHNRLPLLILNLSSGYIFLSCIIHKCINCEFDVYLYQHISCVFNKKELRFQVLTAARINIPVFCVVVLCSSVKVHRRFRGACCLHQGNYHLEPSVNFHLNSRRDKPEDSHLHTRDVTI